MPIITTAKVKTLLQITGSAKDTLIDTLIPIVQNWVVDYLHNDFLVTDIQIAASTIAFVDSDPDTITDSDSGFITAEFPTANIDIHVDGSVRNFGIYQADTVSAGTMTLASGEELIAEAAGESAIVITLVKFPTGIQSVVADMISWKMDKKRLVQSWGLADYREVKTGAGGYPVETLAELTPWRMLNYP